MIVSCMHMVYMGLNVNPGSGKRALGGSKTKPLLPDIFPYRLTKLVLPS